VEGPAIDDHAYRGRRILVTGGSGTIGGRLVDRLLTLQPEVVRVFGRDETKQFHQRMRLGERRDIRYLVGDVRDRERLLRATEGIDTVFHLAALKHVESGEYNPFEATQTNVVGTQNVIEACLTNGVEIMVLASSDKAANPTNVMGASKLLAEKLTTAATSYRGGHRTRFTSVRFGNVLGSRGSALELFAAQVTAGRSVTITDPSMTRFVMSTDRAVELAMKAAAIAQGGEVFVFKMPVARLGDLVDATIDHYLALLNRAGERVERSTIGPRPGEKPFEELMTEDESRRARDIGDMYVLLPALDHHTELAAAYGEALPAMVGAYRSDGETAMTPEEVRRLVAESVTEPGIPVPLA
jgi:UDP-N-acetylglucosamine 4,6-dehydratase